MNKTILVVEDDPDMRAGLQLSLEIEGYNVLTANDGAEALNLLASSVPHLILADLRMPQMNGLRLLDEIRGNEMWHDIPVIVLTAVADPKIQSDVTWRGAHACVTKPFELKTLLDTIEGALCNASRQQAQRA